MRKIIVVLIIALLTTVLFYSQDIELSKAEVTYDGLIVVHYDSNVPCRMYVRYDSDLSSKFYDSGFGTSHNATFIPDKEAYFNVQLIFVGLTGKVTLREFCLNKGLRTPASSIRVAR